jgi:hypothetical protein
MGPRTMRGDERLEAPARGFVYAENHEASERWRWRCAGRATELNANLTMSDRAFLCSRLVNVRRVHGRRDSERQRHQRDQDARGRRKAQAVAIPQHAGSLVPYPLRRNYVANPPELLAQRHGQAIPSGRLRRIRPAGALEAGLRSPRSHHTSRHALERSAPQSVSSPLTTAGGGGAAVPFGVHAAELCRADPHSQPSFIDA